MMEIIVPEDVATLLTDELLNNGVEGAAILLAGSHRRSDGSSRLLVRDVLFPERTDYIRREAFEAVLTPAFVATATKRARRDAASMIFVHSHLCGAAPMFSSIDDDGERALAAFLHHRHSEKVHGALVLSVGGWNARRLGTQEVARVIVLGSRRRVVHDDVVAENAPSEVFDRQIRAFGEASQQALESLRIGIVGLGGTGSLVVQQLAHLGVRQFVLVDADTLETTNLNRVAGATVHDIGRPKVEIAARYISAVVPSPSVDKVQGDVMRAAVAKALCDVDLIFGCTDSHGSRAVLQQVSYQFLIPCIDMGTTIVVAAHTVSHVYGRVQLLSPGHACFTCSGLLSSEQVRRDMMTAFERQADPYVQGITEPAPAVMSLNGVVSSLAVTMLLSIVAGVPMKGRHVLVNAMTPAMRSVRPDLNPSCYICSTVGAKGRGDAWPLFTRQD